MKEHLEEEILNEYLDDALDGERRRAVETHLARCSTCRARLQSLQRLFAELENLKIEEMERDVTPLVLSRLPPRRLSLGWRLVLAVQAGILLALIILAIGLLTGTIPPQLCWSFFSTADRIGGAILFTLILFQKTAMYLTSSLGEAISRFPLFSYRPQFLWPLPVNLLMLVFAPALWCFGAYRLLLDGSKKQ